jgi:hypothetical protein
MDTRARQVRFMSTQKRESRWQRKSCTERKGVLGGQSWSRGRTTRNDPRPIYVARFASAVANGQTAPLVSILWSAFAWMATKFLRSDYLLGQLVRPVLKADRRGSAPPRVPNRAALGTQASPRSSLPHIPYPSGSPRLHPTLPHAPAGHRRRAERYDGKRDMYFQHAA